MSATASPCHRTPPVRERELVFAPVLLRLLVIGYLAAYGEGILHAQSLAALARAGADRSSPATAPVYTNEDLAPAGSPAPEPAEPVSSVQDLADAPSPEPPAAAADAGDTAESASVIVEAPRSDKDGGYWHRRTLALNEHLARTKAAIADQRARLAKLAGAPEDPATARQREVITATIERLARDADTLDGQLAHVSQQADLAARAGEARRP